MPPSKKLLVPNPKPNMKTPKIESEATATTIISKAIPFMPQSEVSEDPGLLALERGTTHTSLWGPPAAVRHKATAIRPWTGALASGRYHTELKLPITTAAKASSAQGSFSLQQNKRNQLPSASTSHRTILLCFAILLPVYGSYLLSAPPALHLGHLYYTVDHTLLADLTHLALGR